MPPNLLASIDVSTLYLLLLLISSSAYTGYIYAKGQHASIGHVLFVGSLHGILWPALTSILATLGMWWGFLPPSTSAFPIAMMITLLPAFAISRLAAADLGSSPLARKADRPPVRKPEKEPSMPPPRPSPAQPQVPKTHGGWKSGWDG